MKKASSVTCERRLTVVKRRYQIGDAGATLLVMMIILVGVWLWHGGPGHGGDRGGHMSSSPSAERSGKMALNLLDETYARGEITREEYLRKREDLLKR